ncbi:hypothetical protein HBH44_130700 [Parastagonospora nodorum]|nr:hypothetical protein HBH45_053960 [Parastagonospora nodorum]KAH4156065.1 hypothetical protein HBH44_130700 [Parastagonospora nodorum]KAH4576147.1 hypothetical protein HBH84_075310 [Parastagonospora nodorum]KAH4624911.1 hypothetical protein HBH55_132480 [Parastagonospora nodorum]KAH5120241.1 hypothetical protein HBH71_073080 [Parastagonospora nodorum]
MIPQIPSGDLHHHSQHHKTYLAIPAGVRYLIQTGAATELRFVTDRYSIYRCRSEMTPTYRFKIFLCPNQELIQ